MTAEVSERRVALLVESELVRRALILLLKPGVRVFVLGEPKLGYGFDEVICLLLPRSPHATRWVADWALALPPGKNITL